MAKLLPVLAVLVCAGAASAAETGRFDPNAVGAPRSGAFAELTLPAGAAPTAAVVVLHGCGGIVPHDRWWAAQIARWGYATLLIDSFRPHGYTEVCNRGQLVPPETQARDAFDGAAYLRARLGLPNAPVGVIGFSHGGWAVLKAVLAGVVRQPDERPFAAAVAFYPGCDPPASPLETDTLILIGGADEWTPAARCERWVQQAQANGHALRFKIYPGALHAFDALSKPAWFAGHYIGRDDAAASDAVAETQAFFAPRLTPR
jgi:dienelactone hydrolase